MVGDAVLHYVPTVSIILLFIVFVKAALFIHFSTRHHDRHCRDHPVRRKHYPPLVSVIIPAHNEELTLENCLQGMLDQTYHCREIIIVDDGSTDTTVEVAQRLADRYRNIWVYAKPWGGKAAALNYGIERANGSIIVSLDADSIFLPGTLEELVLSFQDPKVAAVGGNVRVANRKSVFNKLQATEYITGLTLQRRAFAHLGCMQVISGAIGAFRKDVLKDIGGYSSDTIVEDMDITIELAKRGHKVIFNPNAIAYTEAPETIREFMRQRYRWTYGGFQVIAKHRDILFRRGSNWMGTVGMPYFMIFPWVDVAVSLLLVTAILRIVLTGGGFGLLVFYGLMCLFQASLVAYALLIDREDKRLIVMGVVDSLYYNHLISYTTLRAGTNYLLRRQARWNKLHRRGKNVLQPARGE